MSWFLSQQPLPKYRAGKKMKVVLLFRFLNNISTSNVNACDPCYVNTSSAVPSAPPLSVSVLPWKE